MKKKIRFRIVEIIFTSTLFAISFFSNAQQDSTKKLMKNAIYAEVAGNGLLFSWNFERSLLQKNKFHLCARVGISAYPKVFENGYSVTIPAELNVLIGKKHDFFETGLGNTYNFNNYEAYQLREKQAPLIIDYRSHYCYLRIGYRLQIPRKGGFLLRVGLLPYINYKQGYTLPTEGQSLFGQDEPSKLFVEEKTKYKYEYGIWAGLSFGLTF